MTVIRNELDKRIKSIDDIQTRVQYDDKYVGTLGYFSDNLCNFQNLDGCVRTTLHLIDDKCGDSNDYIFNDGANYYRFFLPESLVLKESKEKKWRAYTGIEFAEKFGIWVGHIIRIRDRPENAGQEYEYKIMFVGYRWYKGMFEVFINGCWIDLLTLFELYEYMEDGEWHKFGVEE